CGGDAAELAGLEPTLIGEPESPVRTDGHAHRKVVSIRIAGKRVFGDASIARHLADLAIHAVAAWPRVPEGAIGSDGDPLWALDGSWQKRVFDHGAARRDGSDSGGHGQPEPNEPAGAGRDLASLLPAAVAGGKGERGDGAGRRHLPDLISWQHAEPQIAVGPR